LPINDAIDRVIATAHELSVAAEKTSRTESCGSRIAQAVKRKTASHGAVFAEALATKAEDQSFGERIKKAVEKRRKQHQEYVERERKRYQQPQPRKRTKGE
jgi:hypothetical protein